MIAIQEAQAAGFIHLATALAYVLRKQLAR